MSLQTTTDWPDCKDQNCNVCKAKSLADFSAGICAWCRKQKDRNDFIPEERTRYGGARCMSCITADREPEEEYKRQKPGLSIEEYRAGLKEQQKWDAMVTGSSKSSTRYNLGSKADQVASLLEQKRWDTKNRAAKTPAQIAEQKKMADAWTSGKFKQQYVVKEESIAMSHKVQPKTESEMRRKSKHTDQYPVSGQIYDQARFGEGFNPSMTVGAASFDDDQVLRVIDDTPNDDYDDYADEDGYPY